MTGVFNENPKNVTLKINVLVHFYKNKAFFNTRRRHCISNKACAFHVLGIIGPFRACFKKQLCTDLHSTKFKKKQQ